MASAGDGGPTHAYVALEKFAVRQEWMADLARRAASVARLDHTMP